MKNVVIIAMCFFIVSLTNAQTNNEDFQSSPEKVMEEIFKAAKTEIFSNLQKLCPPDSSNDGDTQKSICDVENSSKKTKKEFCSYFENGKINGEITYDVYKGSEYAKVPFWFNHPSGGSRCNETMNLKKIGDKWYLSSF